MHERLLQTTFFTALFAYIGFLFLDYLEPGFVSYVFSVHLWGALAVVFGIVWGLRTHHHVPITRHSARITLLVLSTALFWFLWREGAVFGSMRLLLALGAAALPWITWRVLSERDK